MSLWWLYTILAILAGISLAAMVVIATDRRHDRRAGNLETYSDWTLVSERAAAKVPPVRARAHAPALPIPVLTLPLMPRGRVCLVDRKVADELERLQREVDQALLSETELARRVAIQQQPRGADAA